MKHKITAFLAAVCVFTTINAQETRQHDSHAHGMGELNIVVEGNELVIEFISPAANIVGFEHMPGNSEETQALEQAEQSLTQADKLFELTQEAQCILEHTNIESALLSEHETHSDDQAHEEHEAHAEDETHEEHEENETHSEDETHENHEENDGHDGETHSEFHAHYEFQCAEIEKLTEINVTVFNVFPLTESLNVQLLSQSGQSQKSLNPNNTLLTL